MIPNSVACNPSNRVRFSGRHEALDFTPWMLANVDVLSDLLGLELVLDRAEHPVGGFSLDLIGRDSSTDQVVIVENQLEMSDHTHLGQILTYAAGTQPSLIVWVATRFREEHRAALDWLNERTDEQTGFFGVEIAVVCIAESPPAPAFRLVVKPNDWKRVKVGAETAENLRKALSIGTSGPCLWTGSIPTIATGLACGQQPPRVGSTLRWLRTWYSTPRS